MKQSKFSLADVLTVLAALAFGFGCFLSMNFYTLGDTRESVIVAGIVAGLLGGFAFVAKRLKRTSRNFKTCFILEMIFLFLFVACAVIVTISPFPHYFTVSGQKAEIQEKLTESITQAENMFAEYEKYAENREYLYQNKLRSIVAAKDTNPSDYTIYNFADNGISDTKQIENKMFTLHAELFPSNYWEMKNIDSTWLAESRKTVRKWKPIGIVGVVNAVEQNSEEWLKKLVEFSRKREIGEQVENFGYNLSFEDVKSKFTELGTPTQLSVGLSVLAYVLMLLSWFVTKRDSRSTGSLTTAHYEIVL